MLKSCISQSREYVAARLGNLAEANWGQFFVLLVAAAMVVMPDVTVAADDSTISNVICNVVNELQGPVARGVAAVGIIFLGFSLFLGKISWGVALALAIGIGAIFGAKELVGVIGGDGSACTTSSGNSSV